MRNTQQKDTHRGAGPVEAEAEAEIGVVQPGAKEPPDPREHGPAGTWTLDLQPPEL